MGITRVVVDQRVQEVEVLLSEPSQHVPGWSADRSLMTINATMTRINRARALPAQGSGHEGSLVGKRDRGYTNCIARSSFSYARRPGAHTDESNLRNRASALSVADSGLLRLRP
jgi:hypothetical protein